MPFPDSILRSRHPFHAGLIISLLGSLPPGIVNMLLVNTVITQGYFSAIWFGLGSLCAEMGCIGICFYLMQHALRFRFVHRLLTVVTILTLILLCASSFAASARGTETSAVTAISNHAPFVLGFVTMAINPGLIPFWLACTALLIEKKILKMEQPKSGYVCGIALGSMLASTLFILGGRLLLSNLVLNERMLYFSFGCVFLVMLFFHVRKIFLTLRLKDTKNAWR